MKILGIDHIQIAIPAEGEQRARLFYAGLLGLSVVKKPAELAGRGGVWFEDDNLKLHLGVDPDFKPASKAHPGLLVENLQALHATLDREGFKPTNVGELQGNRRFFALDPFGNRLEFLEPI